MTSITRSFRPVHLATIGSIFAGVAGQAALLVSGVIAARLLGVEDRGHLALIALLPVVLVQAGSLGLPVATTYYIARERMSSRVVLRALRRVVLIQCIGLVAVHVAILAAVLGSSGEHVLFAAAISVLSLPAIVAQGYGLAVLQGQEQFRAFSLLRLLPVALYSVGIAVVAAIGEGDLQLVVAAWVVSMLGAAVWTVVHVRKSLPSESGAVAPSLGEMTSFGLRGFLGSASPLETFRLDMVVVGLFLSPADLGLYVAALAFTNLPRFVAQSVGLVAYPTVARRDHSEGWKTMWRFFWFATILSVAIVGAVEVAAGWLVPALFGAEFREAVPIARILLLSALFLSVRRVLSDAARGAGQPTAGTIAELVSWVSLVPALAVLAPTHGVAGVAWALTISSIISAGVLIAIVTASGSRRDRAEEFVAEPSRPPEVSL